MQHLKGKFQLSTPYWAGQKGMQYIKQVAKLSQNKEIVLQLLHKIRHTLKSAAEKSEKFEWETKNSVVIIGILSA